MAIIYTGNQTTRTAVDARFREAIMPDMLQRFVIYQRLGSNMTLSIEPVLS